MLWDDTNPTAGQYVCGLASKLLLRIRVEKCNQVKKNLRAAAGGRMSKGEGGSVAHHLLPSRVKCDINSGFKRVACCCRPSRCCHHRSNSAASHWEELLLILMSQPALVIGGRPWVTQTNIAPTDAQTAHALPRRLYAVHMVVARHRNVARDCYLRHFDRNAMADSAGMTLGRIRCNS